MSLNITPAESPEDIAHIRKLFTEYQEWLDVDLCFQGFQRELDTLPGKYDSLLLARWNGDVCGCVGMWPLAPDGLCEMKRLYVRDDFKGKGIGRKLAFKVVQIAKELGYQRMCLDTLERLAPAIQLYQSMGFRNCAPYYDNPLDQVVYMEKSL